MNIVRFLLLCFLFRFYGIGYAQSSVDLVMNDLIQVRKDGKVFYSQFDYYSPSDNKLLNSSAKEMKGRDNSPYTIKHCAEQYMEFYQS